MEISKNVVVEQINAVLFVPSGGGAPVHTNRKSHGLAFNVAHTTTYRFSDGTVLVCKPGQCIYLPQGCSYTVDKTVAATDVSAGVHAINFLSRQPLAERPFLLQPRSQSAMLAAYAQGEKAWRQRRWGDREICFSCLYTILSLLRQVQQKDATRATELVAPAVAYIHENFADQDITVPALAALCGMSQQYLRRLFQNAYGVSPAVYIRTQRLQYARQLLQTGEYSVSQASQAAGFNDLAYFSREFKAAFGILPSRCNK